MGILEKEVKIKTRNTKIQRAVLGSLAAVGMLSIAVLAPNALRMLKLLGLKIGKGNAKYMVNRAATRLVVAGYAVFEETSKGRFLRITEKGRDRLTLLEVHNFKLKKPNRWDGKWRIVTFDIKEKRKNLRNTIRGTLRAVGFVKLQHSVWVYPYDCEDFITLLKLEYEIEKEVLYVIAEKIENDAPLKKAFGLLK